MKSCLSPRSRTDSQGTIHRAGADGINGDLMRRVRFRAEEKEVALSFVIQVSQIDMLYFYPGRAVCTIV